MSRLHRIAETLFAPYRVYDYWVNLIKYLIKIKTANN